MPQVPWIDINDNGQTADSDQVQQYLDNLRSAVNSLDEDNVNPSSQIALLDQNETVTGQWTFNTTPKIKAPLNEDTIPHSFNNPVTFSGGISAAGITLLGISEITNTKIESVSSFPASPQIGRIVYYQPENTYYFWNGSEWKNMGYTGGYTGGALRPYSGEVIVDDDNPKKIVFKVDSSSTAVKLFLRGTKFPSTFYRELGEHSHGLSGVTITNTVSDSGHTHDVTLGSHTHSGSFATADHTHTINHRHYLNLTSSTAGAHDHGGYTGYAAAQGGLDNHRHTLSSDGDHSHTVSGYTSYDNTTSSSSSAYASVGTTDLGTVTSASATTGISVSSSISGSTDNAGVNGGTLSTTVKTYAKGLTILVNGTDITSAILTATGWTEIGDGTDTHAFVTSGTGEIDIYSYCTTGINYIEIQEPNSGYGGGVLYHIDVY